MAKTKSGDQPATVKVSVKPGSGPFILSLGGDPPRTYEETNGSVDVPEAELEEFLTHVSGSSVALPAVPAAEGETA